TELLRLVDLDPETYRNRYPSQLSGGQQQRIGLARALVTNPKIMLLDEPFGAIDAITRLNLQNELKRIHSETNRTFLLVTHDINEAFRLGNRVMIMDQGKLLQFDTPEEIVRHPADPFVETLISSAREQEDFWKDVME
ncbi:MAG: ATP-binding cassette domain-containing protein, partial [Eubacterium sp.]|nr:ATP-binding cassette domain-containing protein [Eubacterium sp.]